MTALRVCSATIAGVCQERDGWSLKPFYFVSPVSGQTSGYCPPYLAGQQLLFAAVVGLDGGASAGINCVTKPTSQKSVLTKLSGEKERVSWYIFGCTAHLEDHH